jgi:hypothetical protein
MRVHWGGREPVRKAHNVPGELQGKSHGCQRELGEAHVGVGEPVVDW